jgi:phosphohistidine phosphatase
MLDCATGEIDAAAMRLMLLRHAKSEKAEPGMRDRDRELNARGRKDAPKIGAYMAHHGLLPDRVLVSSARRTRETWERMAKAFSDLAVDYDDRLYESGTNAILTVIKETARSARTLLVVGHNPGLYDTARLLIAAGDVETRERLNEGLPTAGLAVIDFVVDDWHKLHARGGRLERFVSPRSLEAAPD